ncbi:hypothetical protein KEK_18648 [Mycolicibacterium thermoresistibile ATCC 19527]|uniref:UPF0102 protein KEK_18648 n=3 Tax=Mycolicibacterium thermoresistibile TaxID=1797 RepID=G7CKP0_MYCT3|nr:hypothetical protein KEK_18648 [Mycolicibacterium thermoresistibile ATCC 19527]
MDDRVRPPCFVGPGAQCGGMATMSRAEIGALGEQLAVGYLESRGMEVLDRNWRCRHGELDVVAADRAARTVVFVEVKTRTGDGFGTAAEAVTTAKVRRLRRLAGLWLTVHGGGWAGIRIDVIGVRLDRSGQLRGLDHFQGVG